MKVSRIRLFAVSLLLLLALPVRGDAPFINVRFRSRWLVADGKASPLLVADLQRWFAQREAFIRVQSVRYPPLLPRLPVVYHLDADFVAAARKRKSMRVVDDCGERELCGVATDELGEDWDAADLRALFTPSTGSASWRDAYAAALLGTFEGENVDLLAADILALTVPMDVRADPPADRLAIVPLRASMIRFIDPGHRLPLPRVQRLVEAMTPAMLAQWRAARPVAVRKKMAAKLPIHGATLSLVNRIESSTFSESGRRTVERLRTLGFDSITLIPFAGQDGFRASVLRRFDTSPHGETDLAMKLPAVRAHRLGMQVMLKPHIWPHGSDVDPTQIEPENWQSWFDSYEKFLVHEALLARSMRAEWLVIGTELSRTEQRPEWLRMIRIARALFPGSIVYAANFDAFERTPFWPELDAIGVDAYFPLSKKVDATDDELRAGARTAVARLDAVARRSRKRVILTEVGYPFANAAWVEPWHPMGAGAAAEKHQSRAFEAMLGAFVRSPNAAGFVVWKYESGSATWPESYRLEGLAAEAVIRRFLASPLPVNSPAARR